MRSAYQEIGLVGLRTLRDHLTWLRWLAVWLVGLALLIRITVPPMFSGKAISIEMCSDYGPVKMAMAMTGMANHHDKKSERDKTQAPCGFSGLSAPSPAGADLLLLALAIAFVTAVARRTAPPARSALPTYSRPPLRGPPVTA